MYVYAKYCPVAAASSIVGDFWTPLIVRELLHGTGSFNQLARNVPGISRAVLTARLRRLETSGIIRRDEVDRGKLAPYRLTPAGQDLKPLIEGLGRWGTRWGAPDATDPDVDPVVSICMLKSRMLATSTPEVRVVMEVTVTSVPGATAWIVSEHDQVSMCFDNPGFEVDLFLSADASTFYQIWLERLTTRDAVRRGLINVVGVSSFVDRFPSWFHSVPILAGA